MWFRLAASLARVHDARGFFITGRHSVADSTAPHDARIRGTFNASLVFGIIAGFAVGAVAGGLLVAALTENANEPTKPFYAAPEPGPGEYAPERPDGASPGEAPPPDGGRGSPAGI